MEQKKGEEESDYFLNTCLDYFPTSIMNALVVPYDWIFHVKKQVDMIKEK